MGSSVHSRYSVGLEIGEESWTYAWVLDLPGCFSRGASPEEALEVLPSRIERLLDWLSGFERAGTAEARSTQRSRASGSDRVLSPIRPSSPRLSAASASLRWDRNALEVAEEVRDPRCPVKRGDTRALFAWDRHAPTRDEFERDLRWMAHHRRTLLTLVQNLPPDVLDQGDPEEEGKGIHDLRAPSVHRILRHIAGAEYWYLTRVPTPAHLPTEEPRDVFAALSAVRAAAEPVLRGLFATAPAKEVNVPETTWSGTFTEGWTLRKILRRTLWHEGFHIEEIRRHLEGRSGDRAAVGTA